MAKAQVFLSYARKDVQLRAELVQHLQVLIRSGLIEYWDDLSIRAGDEWNPLILQSLDQADIILLLLTPSYAESEYAWNREMMRAMERQQIAQATVVPIIAKPFHWQTAPFAKLQVLPEGGASAVTSAPNREEAWAKVVTHVAKIAKGLLTDGRIRTDPVSGGQYVWIAPGTFVMGKNMPGKGLLGQMVRAVLQTETPGEGPAHTVTITKGFWIGRFVVTQAQWERVMKTNPSNRRGMDLPVESVTWNDCARFLNQMLTLDPLHTYRLPTEAEWEYAARAGSTENLYGHPNEIAWWRGNSDMQTHPVGKKRPNAWGLFDTIGNVTEWCQDWHDLGLVDGNVYYEVSPKVDPLGHARGIAKVVRGCFFDTPEFGLRVTAGHSHHPDMGGPTIGFRCVMQERD